MAVLVGIHEPSAAVLGASNIMDISKGRINNKYCCVPYCKSKIDKAKKISIHRFPKDKELRKKWQIILRIGKRVTDTMYVCSKHFLPTDFTSADYPAEVPMIRQRLKEGVVPSQNIPKRRHDANRVSGLAASRVARLNKRNEKKQERLQDSLAEEQLELCNYQHHCCNTDTKPLSEDESVNETEIINDAVESLLMLASNASDKDQAKVFEDKSVQVNTLLQNSKRFTLTELLKSEKDLKAFTGLPSAICLKKIVSMLETLNIQVSSVLTTTDIVVLVMTKLKLALSFRCLAVLFQISETTCSTYFHHMSAILSEVMKTFIVWPSKDEILANMPACFGDFRNVRIVLDCTEIVVQKPSCLRCRIFTYSHYYGDHTVKVLIGISPGGIITFLEKVYGGRTSDKVIFENSELIKSLNPHSDDIMVDKGFLIDEECSIHGINIIRPPFLTNKAQFDIHEALLTYKIARARVHVERAIQRVKVFKILSTTLEWTMLPYFDYILTIIAGVVNLSKPILADDKF